jgi:hypothetical protein
MSARRDAIHSIYAGLRAPDWAATNLDGLADVLRDLSWLPPGPVRVRWRAAPELPDSDRRAILEVLEGAVAETADGPRPIHLS